MILNLSDDAGNVMLDALAGLMNGGSLEIVSDTQRVLATLRLSNPDAADAVDGQLRAKQDHRGRCRAGHRDCHGRARPHADRRRGSFLRRWRQEQRCGDLTYHHNDHRGWSGEARQFPAIDAVIALAVESLSVR